jgi:GxxExxY protein
VNITEIIHRKHKIATVVSYTKITHINNKIMEKYPHKELTYKINGLIFDVYKELNFGYQEKYYQRAFELTLNENKLSYKKELHVPITFKEKFIGRYFIDFLIEDKIVVEFKIANEMHQRHFQQVYSYLKAKNLQIGLLALITKDGIKIKRIIN